MSRYIDADALCEELTRFVRKANNHDFEPTPTWNDAVAIFHSVPTIDTIDMNLINRQDAIDLVEKWFLKIGLNGDICLDGLRSLPTVNVIVERGDDENAK